jgi:hypothetical protein
MNIERIESGPAWADKTGGCGFWMEAEVATDMQRQISSYGPIDLADHVDEEAVELAKAGKATELGALLIKRMRATALRQVAWWEAA